MFSILLQSSLSAPTYSLTAKELVISGDGVIDNTGVQSEGSTQNVIRVIIKNGPSSIHNKAFYKMLNLEYIEIPDSITFIEKQPFGKCEKLVTIKVSGTSNDFCSENNILYTKNKDLLIRAPVIKELSIPEGVKSIQEYAFEVGDFVYGDLVLPSSLTTLFKNAFYDSNFNSISFKPGCKLQTLHSFSYAHVGTITIPPSVTKLDEEAFYYAKITNIKFEEGSKLTDICKDAFQLFRCDTLILPDSLKTIHNTAFKESELKTIYIGSGCSNISSSAFAGCKYLTNVTVSKDNTVYSSNDGGVKSKEELIFIPNDTKTIYIPKTIRTIGKTMLQSSTKLTEITLDKDDTYWGTNGGVLYANNFQELVSVCGGVGSVEADARTTKIRGYAAYGCSKLTSFKFLGEITTEIGEYSFSSSAIASFKLPKGVTTMGKHAFEKTSNMNSFTMDNDTPLTIINYKCFCSSGITSFNLGRNVEYLYTSCFCQCYSLTDFTIPLDSHLSDIQEYSFGEDSIKSIVFPASLTKFGKKAFQLCDNLEKVEFKETQQLTVIQELAFADCSKLREVILPQSLTTIEQNTFINCTKLVSVKHNLEIIGNSAFQNCVSLENFNFSARQSKTYLNPSIFMKCYKLMDFYVDAQNRDIIVINGSVYSADEEILYIFPPGREMAKIPPNTVKFAANAFAWSINIKVVAFYSNSNLLTIGKTAFYDCVNLKLIQFPPALVTIETEGFYGCTSLTSIILPASLNTIGEGSFIGCNSLRFVKYCGTNEITGTKVFEDYALILVSDLYLAPEFCSKPVFRKLSFTCELKPEYANVNAPSCEAPPRFRISRLLITPFLFIVY